MEENKRAVGSVDQRLGTAPLVPLIFSLALPTALAQLVNMLYNIVDRIYVGHIPGTGSLALAGLGVTYPIIVLITAFSNLIGMGGAPRASVAMGRGDYKTAEKILGNCVTLLIVLSVALSVVFTVFGEPVLRAFGASENTLPYAMSYLRIYLLGTIFVQFTLGMTPFITNQGFAGTSMATTCIGGTGYSILYEYGIFKQKIVDGWQQERADNWLPGGQVWLKSHPEQAIEVRFDGEIRENWDHGFHYVQHLNYNSVMAVPSDMYVQGYDGAGVAKLRLWQAKAPDFDMSSFSLGNYSTAMSKSASAELISKVLYPNDNHYAGKELRLKQQYFFISASVQEAVEKYMRKHDDVLRFYE